MGVGMSVICAEADVESVRTMLADEGLSTFRMGVIVSGSGKVRYC
jgi:phosphoribosylaminoimidazole (AIR) synthetase